MLQIHPSALAPPGGVIIPPVEGIAAWARPGVSAVQSARNAVEDGAAFVLVGTPAGYAKRSIDLKSVTTGSYLEAPVAPSALTEWTLLSVAAPLDAVPYGTEAPQYVSGFHAAAGNMLGFGLGGGGGGASTSSLARGTYCGVTPDSAGASVATFVQTPWPANPAAIRATAFRGRNGGIMRVDDLTEGTAAEALDIRTTPSPSQLAKFRVGSSGSGTGWYGRVRLYYAAIIPRVLTDDELALAFWTEQRSLKADGVIVALAI